jgi:hypothetical protein
MPGIGLNPYPLTFTGSPHRPVLPATFPCGLGNATLLSRLTNDAGTFENITGLSPADGAQMRLWNVAIQDFDVYTFSAGIWYPAIPSVPIGSGAVITVPGHTNSPPPNDQFAGAITLNTGLLYTMDTTWATSSNPPSLACQTNFGKGVWFSYTAISNGAVTVNSCKSQFDTVLQAYTGSAGALTPVAGGCNSSYGPACPADAQASMTFQARAGMNYHIFAGGVMGGSGLLHIGVFPAAPAPTPPQILTMGTFTLQVLNYDSMVWDGNSDAFTGASGYAQTSLACDSASYNCVVHFDNLTISLPGLPNQGVVNVGTASYPTSPPQGPSLAIPVAGFTLLFDGLSLQSTQANAQIRLQFPGAD